MSGPAAAGGAHGGSRVRIKGRKLSVARFLMLSIAFTIPWIIMLSQLTYYSKLYGPQVLLQLNIAYYLPSIPILLVVGNLERLMDEHVGNAASMAIRLSVGMMGCAAISAAYPFMPPRLSCLLAVVVALGSISAVAFSTSYQLVAWFRSADTIALGIGCVTSGPLSLVIQLALHIGTTPRRWQWIALFECAAGLVLAGLLAAWSLLWQYWAVLSGQEQYQDGALPLLGTAEQQAEADEVEAEAGEQALLLSRMLTMQDPFQGFPFTTTPGLALPRARPVLRRAVSDDFSDIRRTSHRVAHREATARTLQGPAQPHSQPTAAHLGRARKGATAHLAAVGAPAPGGAGGQGPDGGGAAAVPSRLSAASSASSLHRQQQQQQQQHNHHSKHPSSSSLHGGEQPAASCGAGGGGGGAAAAAAGGFYTNAAASSSAAQLAALLAAGGGSQFDSGAWCSGGDAQHHLHGGSTASSSLQSSRPASPGLVPAAASTPRDLAASFLDELPLLPAAADMLLKRHRHLGGLVAGSAPTAASESSLAQHLLLHGDSDDDGGEQGAGGSGEGGGAGEHDWGQQQQGAGTAAAAAVGGDGQQQRAPAAPLPVPGEQRRQPGPAGPLAQPGKSAAAAAQHSQPQQQQQQQQVVKVKRSSSNASLCSSASSTSSLMRGPPAGGGCLPASASAGSLRRGASQSAFGAAGCKGGGRPGSEEGPLAKDRGGDAAAAGGVAAEYWEVVRGTWMVVLAALVSSTLLNCIFPFFTYVESTGLLGEFLPQVLFYTRMLSDISGRLAPRKKALAITAPALLLSLSTVLLLCSAAFFVHLQAPPAVQSDLYVLGLVFVLWLAGGYINTMSYILAPSLVPPRVCTKASALMALTYQVAHILGLLLAIALALGLYGDISGGL